MHLGRQLSGFILYDSESEPISTPLKNMVHPVKAGKPYKRMPSRRKALVEALFSPSGSIGSVRLSSEHTYRSGPLPPGTPCARRPVGTILPLHRPSRARPAGRRADLDRLSRGRNYISQGRQALCPQHPDHFGGYPGFAGRTKNMGEPDHPLAVERAREICRRARPECWPATAIRMQPFVAPSPSQP